MFGEHGATARASSQPGATLGVILIRSRQELEGDLSPEARVLSQIHLSHSAGAELFLNKVMGNFF